MAITSQLSKLILVLLKRVTTLNVWFQIKRMAQFHINLNLCQTFNSKAGRTTTRPEENAKAWGVWNLWLYHKSSQADGQERFCFQVCVYISSLIVVGGNVMHIVHNSGIKSFGVIPLFQLFLSVMFYRYCGNEISPMGRVWWSKSLWYDTSIICWS